MTADAATYAAMVKPAQDAKFGDFQANCAMPLAKQLKSNPRDTAAQIIAKLEVGDLCHPPEIAGPGFINLRLRDDWLSGYLGQLAGDERLGVPTVKQPQTIVVDYSSPNVAKPMHVGHLRSSVIGDSLCRIMKFLGHRVISDNHLGDWGTQFGMIIYGYKNFLDRAAFEREPVTELARLYKLVNQLCDWHELVAGLPQQKVELAEAERRCEALSQETPPPAEVKEHQKRVKKLRGECDTRRGEIAAAEKKIAGDISAELVKPVNRSVSEDASSRDVPHKLEACATAHPHIVRLSRLETAKLHAGDPENRRLWHEFLPACLAALQKVYDQLGVSFDHTLGESFYDPMLADVVDELTKKGLSVASEGAVCVFLEGLAAPMIIKKADGAFTYATTDLATIRYRVEHWKADTILYVVDTRQSDHFRQLFAAAQKWGYSVACRHINFGTVLGKDGRPYKTRDGDTVGLESLLSEAVKRARAIVEEQAAGSPDRSQLADAAKDDIAEVVGIGAIKYADLHHNRESDYEFDWEKMLALRGDTATYLQYAYARTCGILRKCNVTPTAVLATPGAISLGSPPERALARRLTQFPEAIAAAASESRPNFVTQFLFDLAGDYSTFHESCDVSKEPDPAVRLSRQKLVALTGRTITLGLSLLNIQTRDMM